MGSIELLFIKTSSQKYEYDTANKSSHSNNSFKSYLRKTIVLYLPSDTQTGCPSVKTNDSPVVFSPLLYFKQCLFASCSVDCVSVDKRDLDLLLVREAILPAECEHK